MHRLVKTWKFALPAAASLALVLLLAACGNDDDDNDVVNGNNNDVGDPVTEITIDMGDNWFEPDHFVVRVGETVTVTVDNVGAAIHNMKIMSADAEGQHYESDPMVNPGETDTFEFTFSTPGTYDFQCDYHLPEMVGTLTVIE
jgi:plastocyanin